MGKTDHQVGGWRLGDIANVPELAEMEEVESIALELLLARDHIAELGAALRDQVERWGRCSAEEAKWSHSWYFDDGRMKTYEFCADELSELIERMLLPGRGE